MAMNDLIADLITRIRNAQRVKKTTVVCHSFKLGNAVLDVLKLEGYIRGYKVQEVRSGISEAVVELKYFDGEPVIRKIVRASKSGRRMYASTKNMKRFCNGLGVSVISTSKGVLSDAKALDLNVGGEVLCQVF